MSAALDAVRFYAQHGWRVFPLHAPRADGTCDCGRPDCASVGKHPWTADGVKSATTNLATIHAWWQQYPGANVAIAAGKESGLVVLDVDPGKGGEESLNEIIATYGRLPATVESLTGGGGRHIFFAHPGIAVPNSASKLGPGLDIRGDGGYIAAPPSRHRSGNAYEWEVSSRPSKVQLAPMPGWMLTLLTTRTYGQKAAPPADGRIYDGNRNVTLASLGGTMRRRGFSPPAIESALLAENAERCVPTLGDDEVREIARSIARYEPDTGTYSGTETETEPTLQREGDAVIWLWRSLGLGIGFDLLRETSYGLQGEVSIQTIDATNGGDRYGHIHHARFNLSDTGARSGLSNFLAKRREGIDWPGLLEVACYRTVELWREGEPVVDLSTLPVSRDDGFLIDRLLPLEETTVIFADGGSGKSYLALALAVATRTGVALPGGFRPVRTGNVLYLDWEANARTHNNRLDSIARGFGMERPPILYRAMHRSLADDVAKLRKEVARHAIGLVVVDSIGPACGGEPENAETMLRAFNALRSLAPATRLVISHVSKSGAEQKNGSARPFGSVFVQNMARSVWELRKADEAAGQIDVALFHRKANEGQLYQPAGLRIVFDGPGRTVRFEPSRVEDSPDLAAHASLSYRIRAMLRSGSKKTADLADELEASEDSIRKALNRMPDAIQVDPGGGRGKVATWGLRANGEEEPRF